MAYKPGVLCVQWSVRAAVRMPIILFSVQHSTLSVLSLYVVMLSL